MNCHNGEKYLKKSLDSLINQSYDNWELIFWDNQSQDNSKKILESYKEKKFKYFYNEKKTTLYKARNLGIKKATGDYICFLDTDDFWAPNKLEKQKIFFQSNPSINVVYGNYFIINEKLNTKKLAHKTKNLPRGKIFLSLLENYRVGLLTLCFKKNIFLKFDERFDIIGDFDSVLKISKKEKFGVIDEPLSFYRFHNDNFSLLNKNKHFNELKTWYEENIKFDNKISDKIKNKFINEIKEIKLIALILNGKKTKALSLIFEINSLFKIIRFIIFLFIPATFLKYFINR